MEEEKMKRFCQNCIADTIQVVKLYNPDDPESDEVWECSECKENTAYAN